MPAVWIEPGRSVEEAGVVYTVIAHTKMLKIRLCRN